MGGRGKKSSGGASGASKGKSGGASTKKGAGGGGGGTAAAGSGAQSLDSLIAAAKGDGAGGGGGGSSSSSGGGSAGGGDWKSIGALANAAADRAPAFSDLGGLRKVFISDAYAQAAKMNPGLSRETFNRGIVTALRNGLVRLARADFVRSMDLAKVDESEIANNGATLHFILRG